MGDGLDAFASAVRGWTAERGLTLGELGKMVATRTGRFEPYAQTTVSRWLNEAAPPPEVVFALEDVLEAPSGSLSRQLGYLPADYAPATSVVDAIMADPHLQPAHKQVLARTYETLVEEAKERSQRRRR